MDTSEESRTRTFSRSPVSIKLWSKSPSPNISMNSILYNPLALVIDSLVSTDVLVKFSTCTLVSAKASPVLPCTLPATTKTGSALTSKPNNRISTNSPDSNWGTFSLDLITAIVSTENGFESTPFFILLAKPISE